MTQNNCQKMPEKIWQLLEISLSKLGFLFDRKLLRSLDEFCYRINRSQSKNNIFNNLIERMVKADKKYQPDFICS